MEVVQDDGVVGHGYRGVVYDCRACDERRRCKTVGAAGCCEDRTVENTIDETSGHEWTCPFY